MPTGPANVGPITGILLVFAVGLTACTGNVRQSAPVLTVAAVGDIMLGTDFPENRLPDDDGHSLLGAVSDHLKAADIAFGNLEGTLADGVAAEKRCETGPCYLFRSPSRYARHLQRAGFDVVSLANNHSRDFGEAGREATMRALDRVGIRYSGRFGEIASWVVKGRRVGLLAFAPFVGANPMLDLETAGGMIRDAKRDHDIVIVSFHGGAEGEEHARLPFAEEYFHNENRGDVVAFARAAVDAGADLVIGHGPHVPRALELYKDRLIAYSLGNFCTFWGIKVTGYNGLAPLLIARIGADGRFVDGRILSARQERPHGPRLDPEHQAARLIKRLTAADFPHSRLRIDALGAVRVVTPDPAVAALGP